MPRIIKINIDPLTDVKTVRKQIKQQLREFALENNLVAQSAAYNILKRNLDEFIKNSKDAHATLFRIMLPFDYEVEGKIKILIQDDGDGFPPEMLRGGETSYGTLLTAGGKIQSSKDHHTNGGTGQGLAQASRTLKKSCYQGDLLVNNLNNNGCSQITLISNTEPFVDAEFRSMQQSYDTSLLSAGEDIRLTSGMDFDEYLAKRKKHLVGLDDTEISAASLQECLPEAAVMAELGDFYSDQELAEMDAKFKVNPQTPDCSPPKMRPAPAQRHKASIMPKRMFPTIAINESGGSQIIDLDDDAEIPDGCTVEKTALHRKLSL